MDTLIFEQIVLLAAIGAIVGIVARRLRLPYMPGLVIAGIVIGFLPWQVSVPFNKDLLFDVLLPPLIFEAGLNIKWRELRRDLRVVGIFAVAGVMISALVTAALMHVAGGWVWPAAILFGVLIAATDPVSIIATFKDANVVGRLRLLVEAESLFNDSTAAVGFAVALAFATGQSPGLGSAIWQLALTAAGGGILGLLIAVIALLVIGRAEDELAELALTTLAAFGSFWAAEHFGFSGILATTAAGLVIGNRVGGKAKVERSEAAMLHFWEFAAYLANAIIFILLGIALANQNFGSSLLIVAFAIVAVLAGRALAVYPLSAIFSRSSQRVPVASQHTLFWGGLRGALALALALAVPESLPYRQEILMATFGVVAFSVFAQGTTVTLVMRNLGELPTKNSKRRGRV